MNQNDTNRPTLDDYDDEALRHPERYPNKTLSVIGKCIKWFFIALAVAVFAVMIWRINAMEHLPKSIKTLTVNEATHAAYLAAESRGETLEMFTQGKIDPISTNDEAYGYFWVAESVIIPEAQQLQLVVRYNNSTLEHLASDFDIGYIPDRSEEVLAIRLRVVEDATPDNPEDNEDESTWSIRTLTPTGEPVTAQKDVYNYRRYVFDQVPTDDHIIGLIVDFYYVGAIDDGEPLAQLYVYYERAKNEDIKLTKNDIAALEEFGQK
ncbi:MAG: hypothetical protein IJW40_02990 [Clostridia bacterium]|nr:hypothetical protein [Clostridia bacterium]